MPEFLLYLGKANLLLLVFYLVYRVGLRPLTFYGLNRGFLWAGMGLSVFLPWVRIPLLKPAAGLDRVVVPYVADWGGSPFPQSPVVSAGQWWLWIFALGALVMGVRFVLQLASLARIHHRCCDAVVFGQAVKQMSAGLSPFSFLRYIYVNPGLYGEGDLRDIIRHEQMHIRGWHTVDLLAAELLKVFCWYNPAAWLMKKAIAQNLEFLCDRAMLRTGEDRRAYQYSLVRTSRAMGSLGVVNPFNVSHLKIRIMMMNKQKSAPLQLLRYGGALAVVFGAALWVTASRAESAPSLSAAFPSLTDSVPAPERISPAAPHSVSFHPDTARSTGNRVSIRAASGTIRPENALEASGRRGALTLTGASAPSPRTITFSSDAPAPGASAKSAETVRVTGYGPSGLRVVDPAAASGQTLFALEAKDNRKPPLYVVNFKIVDAEQITRLQASDIKSITVIKGEKALKLFGRKGRHGVVMIATRNLQATTP